MNRKVLVGGLVVLLLHIGLFVFKNYLYQGVWSDALQQENYLLYVKVLRSGEGVESLSYADSRLFPGLPFLISMADVFLENQLLAGMMVTVVSLVVVYRIAVYFTNNVLYSVWLTIFPPIVFDQLSKVSTEAVVVALLLLTYWLISKKNYLWASSVLGYATVVRPIAGFMFLALLTCLVVGNKLRLRAVLIYLFFPLLLLIFNVYHWGLSSSLYQLEVYSVIGRATIGTFQLIKDIYRAIDWGQWRILVSGLSYMTLYGFILRMILKQKGNFLFKGDGKMIKVWGILTTMFILLVSPTPLLEEIRRFMAVFFPLALMVNYKFLIRQRMFLLISLVSSLIVFV